MPFLLPQSRQSQHPHVRMFAPDLPPLTPQVRLPCGDALSAQEQGLLRKLQHHHEARGSYSVGEGD